jgi:alpha-amylase
MRILHLLNWKLTDVDQVLADVASQGFDAIQINPLQPLKEDNFNNWWLSYQPCGFHIGNQYGSKEDLEKLCQDAHLYGLNIYADVICTHVAGANDGSLTPHEKVDKELTANPYLWREKKRITNWDSRSEAVNYCAGLPSFDMQNYDLQDKVIVFLNEMIDCGVDGFRFDSAKSIRTPKEGCDFFPRVLGQLNRQDLYNYGEVIFASEDLISLYTDYIDVLTNTWSKNKDHVVAFSESHDTYYEFGYTKNKTPQEITEDYGRISETYPNSIYYARSFDNEWKSPRIKEINNQNKVNMNNNYLNNNQAKIYLKTKSSNKIMVC